jgi:predicted nucleotidyltransferase component of viral defense system
VKVQLPTIDELATLNAMGMKYPMPEAEQDYFLTLILKIIAESHLGEKLAFKGGNAVNRVYFDQYRYSNDLDFESIHEVGFEDVERLLIGHEQLLNFEHEYLSLPSFRLHMHISYKGIAGDYHSTKLDINNHSKLLLPPHCHPYRNPYGIEFSVLTMDVKELAAEKLRAMNGRTEYRDFYDFTNLMLEYTLDYDDVVALFMDKQSLFPKQKDRIIVHWEIIKANKSSFFEHAIYNKTINNSLIEAVLDDLQIPDSCDWKRKQTS